MTFAVSEFELPTPSTDDLVGTWHIVQTTFPMWRNGKNTHPTLNYARHPSAGASKLSDLVVYRKRGKSKQIHGVDTQDPNLPCHFTWRGSGLLTPLTSDWYVVDLDSAASQTTNSASIGVIGIYFSKTLFTPAGLDLATTAPIPDPAVVDACLTRIRQAAILRPFIDDLVKIDHT